jgi:apolipoprotein D and lipocalin family protein
MARYSFRPDGKMEVVNSCRKPNGGTKSVRGAAKVVDRETNAKLKVTFFWPFWGDYWVLMLDPEYRYAVVGEPRRKYLWILSRTPRLDAESYSRILKRIGELGYIPSKIAATQQSQR